MIDIKTWLAVIQGPGLEMACRTCRQAYLITEDGATPITDEDLRRDFIDATGQRFKLPPLE